MARVPRRAAEGAAGFVGVLQAAGEYTRRGRRAPRRDTGRTRCRTRSSTRAMRVVVVPCLSDNYAYLLVDEAAGVAAVVEPSEAGPVLEALNIAGVASVCAVLVTHHHGDHVGGLRSPPRALARRAGVWAHLGAFGRAYRRADRGPRRRRALRRGALHGQGVPRSGAHHRGARLRGGALYGRHAVWCGRLFEGTAATMYTSLQRLRALNPALAVYPGHEYTVEESPASRRACSPTTTPSPRRPRRPSPCATPTGRRSATPSARERRTNPFLRCDEALVQGALGTPGDPVAAFGALRARRDVY